MNIEQRKIQMIIGDMEVDDLYGYNGLDTIRKTVKKFCVEESELEQDKIVGEVCDKIKFSL